MPTLGRPLGGSPFLQGTQNMGLHRELLVVSCLLIQITDETLIDKVTDLVAPKLFKVALVILDLLGHCNQISES